MGSYVSYYLSPLSCNQEKDSKDSNQIKLKDELENVKSKYILKKIFFNLTKGKFLNIIKYNNKLKNRLNISINDFKEYSEIFSPIEIEIIPIQNTHCEFINIKSYKQNENFYHIYFNDNKNEEIKRNYLNKDDKVDKITFIIDYQVKSFFNLFFHCNFESINFKKFYRNNINNMNGTFKDCYLLKKINFSSFNTVNVINMSNMFKDCDALKELDLSNFITNNVTDMNSMFYRCSSLKKLNISSFNTNKVRNMSWMFYGCKSLNELNLSNFNTDKVIVMYCMFTDCTDKLKKKIKKKYNNIKEDAFT